MAPAGLEEPRLDLVVAGHVNIDRFLDVEKLPSPDRTVPITDDRSQLGGTAATIARTAAQAGARVGLVARIGEDFPESFVAQLRRDRVDLEGLERVSGARSPACYIVEDGRGHQFTLIYQGPMGDAREAVIPDSLLASASWAHLTTGDPDYILRLKETARQRGVRVAVDPAQEIHYRWTRDPLEELLDGSELLFANRGEVQQALRLLRLRKPEHLLDRVPMVLMTDGPKGSVAYTRRGTVRVPSVPVKGRHQATGAGDAFRGGFYAAFFRGMELAEAMTAGATRAAEWIRRDGGFGTPS